jgi:hypothetical protein
MTRAEAIEYICSQFRLSRYQAQAMVRQPGDWYVLRAEYPGGAPNPIIGVASTWSFTEHDEHYRVTRDGKSFQVTEVQS